MVERRTVLGAGFSPWALLAASVAALAGCPARPVVDAGPVDARVDDITDGAIIDDIAADAPPPRPPWPHTLQPAAMMGEPRGMHTARVIIHSHSVHSHDACDGEPYVDGGPNEPCLGHFRAALCATRVDVDFLTEHAGLMADGSFERTLQIRPGDEPVMDGTGLVGYRVVCPDGHRALVLPGAENALMPIGLTRHPDLVGGSLGAAYNADDAAAVARFHAAGALVAIPHTEQRTLAHLQELGPDLIEVYNIHANVDPRIAGPYLHIDVGPLLLDVSRFGPAWANLEPDLVFLAFFRESETDLVAWGTFWAQGTPMPGIAGTDSHENTFPSLLPDGERGDSYRRMFRWFSNVVRVDGPIDREHTMAALRLGHSYIAFEAFGTPADFDCLARGTSGAVTEMGGSTLLSDAPTITVTRPTVLGLDPALTPPTVRLRILRADATAAAGWVEVASGSDPTLTFQPTLAGAYRAEVRIVPEHVRPYLPRLERLVHDAPWVYGNPIAVR